MCLSKATDDSILKTELFLNLTEKALIFGKYDILYFLFILVDCTQLMNDFSV